MEVWPRRGNVFFSHIQHPPLSRTEISGHWARRGCSLTILNGTDSGPELTTKVGKGIHWS